jgi:hypothetical protein
MSLPADAAVQQQTQPVIGEVPEALPDSFTFLMSRLTASVGPLEQPSVA